MLKKTTAIALAFAMSLSSFSGISDIISSKISNVILYNSQGETIEDGTKNLEVSQMQDMTLAEASKSETTSTNQETQTATAATEPTTQQSQAPKLNSENVSNMTSETSTPTNTENTILSQLVTPFAVGEGIISAGINYKVTVESGSTFEVAVIGLSGQTAVVGGKVIIPAQIDYSGKTYKVTSLAPNSFYGNTIVDEFVLPEGIRSIGAYAFGYSTLKNMNFPSTLTSIENSAFRNCSIQKADLSQTNLQTISTFAFYKTPSLKEVKFNDSLKKIEASAFNTSSLNSFSLPDGLEIIEQSAFASNNFITEITIPGTVKVVSANAFVFCGGLKKVVLEEGVQHISTDAFGRSNSIESVEFPSTINYVEALAFSDSRLTEIVLLSEDAIIEQYAFGSGTTLKTATFHSSVSLASNVLSNNKALTNVYFVGDTGPNLTNMGGFITNIANVKAQAGDKFAQYVADDKTFRNLNFASTVKYIANGGKPTPEAKFIYPGNKVIKPEIDPVIFGNNFVGWYEDSLLTKLYDFNTINNDQNVRLYAKFEATSYKVQFEPNNGSAIQEIAYKYNELIIKPPNPTKAGYNFVGWYKDIALTDSWTDVYMPANDLKVYGKWNPLPANVEFETNGGSNVSTIQSQTDAKITAPFIIKPYNTFKGWYKEAGLINQWDFANDTVPAGGTKLYAKWEVNSYNLTLNPNGGPTFSGSGQIKYGEKIPKPADVPYANYHFLGWGKDANGTAFWNFATETMPGNSLTLYAIWEGDPFKLIYNPDNGQSSQHFTVNFNSNVSTPHLVVTKTGHTFSNWYKDPTFTTPWIFGTDVDATKMPNSDTNLYAKWNVNSYNFTYDPSGGTFPSPPYDGAFHLGYGSILPKIDDPVKTNYTFGGWYKEIALTNKLDYLTDKMIDKDWYVYAKWIPNEFKYYLDPKNGGEVIEKQAGYGLTLPVPATVTKPGYSFKYWSTTENPAVPWVFGIGSTNLMPAKELFFEARWNVLLQKVIFVGNIGDPDIVQDLYTDTLITTQPNYVKPNHVIEGWYSEATFINKWNFATDKVPAGGVTLYAKWVGKPYPVTFNSNGGTSVEGIDVDFDDLIMKPSDPLRENYTFDAWYKDATLTEKWNFSTNKMPAPSLTLYAKWIGNPFEVTFNSNGGTNSVDGITKITNYADKVVKPTDPTRAGYTFIGWYKEPELTTLWNFGTDTMPANNITLYAKWTANSQIIIYYDPMLNQTLYTLSGKTDELVVKPPTPVKTGYTFVSWYKEPNLLTQWNFATDKIPPNSLALFAKWEINKYLVKFETSNGEELAEEVVQDKLVEYDNLITMPTEPTMKGYEFSGWFKEPQHTSAWDFGADKMPNNPITLYAKWIAIPYQLIFNPNNGDAIQTQTKFYKDKITPLNPEPTKFSDKFSGWFLDIMLSKPFNFDNDKMPNKDLNLYAKFVPYPNSVYGTVTDNANLPMEGVTITLGGETTQTNSLGQYQFKNMASGNLFITAMSEGYLTQITNVTVVDGEKVKKDFVMESGNNGTFFITGKITDDESGVAISGAKISDGTNIVQSDSRGFYIIGLFQGNTTTTLNVNHTDYLPKQASIKINTTNAKIDFALEKKYVAGWILGYVSETKGSSLENAEVKIYGPRNFKMDLKTATYGDFTQMDLRPGKYFVSASLEGYTYSSALIDVYEGKETQVFLHLSKLEEENEDKEQKEQKIATQETTVPTSIGAYKNKPYISGYGDNTFRCDNDLTRAEAAMIFYKILKGGQSNGAKSEFKDLNKDAWYYDAISTLESLDILKGYPDGTFRPESNITRAEFSTIIAKSYNLKNEANFYFYDVKQSYWANKYISAVVNTGWASGYKDLTFHPEDNITRAEAVSIVNHPENKTLPEKYITEIANPFKDVKNEQWAYDEIIQASVEFEIEIDVEDLLIQ